MLGSLKVDWVNTVGLRDIRAWFALALVIALSLIRRTLLIALLATGPAKVFSRRHVSLQQAFAVGPLTSRFPL